jgi:hypothetical protein
MATSVSPYHAARSRAATSEKFGRRSVLVQPPEDESPAVAPSREVAIRAPASYTDRLAGTYRAWVDAGAPGFDPLEARDAAQECAHGRLPHDRTQVCRCWADDPTRTAPIPKEQTTMEAVAQPDAAEAQQSAPPERLEEPIRLRRDGRPDKRYSAGGSTSRAGRRSRGTRPQSRTDSSTRRAGAPATAPENPTLARMVGELDRESDALGRARAALVGGCMTFNFDSAIRERLATVQAALGRVEARQQRNDGGLSPEELEELLAAAVDLRRISEDLDARNARAAEEH